MTSRASASAPRTHLRRATRGRLTVRAVEDRRDLDAFIRLPWRLYEGVAQWVAPLLAERRHHLDREANPFFRHAAAEYFLAWRGSTPVGRISAHVDDRLDEAQGEPWGLFGFFECEADDDAAAALLDAAEAWLRARGRQFARGPFRSWPPTTTASCR